MPQKGFRCTSQGQVAKSKAVVQVKSCDLLDERLDEIASSRAAGNLLLALMYNAALTRCLCGVQRALDAQIMPDAVLMGRVLFAHARCKDWHGAMATFRWMYEIGVKPGAFTFKWVLLVIFFLLSGSRSCQAVWERLALGGIRRPKFAAAPHHLPA